MTKEEYLELRAKLIRQLKRSQSRESLLPAEHMRSDSGHKQAGYEQGYQTSLENTIDQFDNYFGIPYDDNIENISN